jgi:hypothetical protein
MGGLVIDLSPILELEPAERYGLEPGIFPSALEVVKQKMKKIGGREIASKKSFFSG